LATSVSVVGGRPTPERPVVVVGAGISGLACARALQAAGVPVRVLDRGRKIGGRLASRALGGRRADLGASYLTVSDDRFRVVVEDWLARGVARPWTDTFHTATPEGLGATVTGPQRYAGTTAQRALAEDLAGGLDVRSGQDVEYVARGEDPEGQPAAAVVLAMPDPQASDLLADDFEAECALLGEREWTPALALVAGFGERSWEPALDGAFVSGSEVLRWVADDGRRRGDGAPVLVAHSTPAFAAPLLDTPQDAGPGLLAALRDLLRIRAEPEWTHVQRWSLSAPVGGREQRFHLGDAGLGLCGDGWGSKVETAWLSGHLLGEELAARCS
jgi:renalase